VGLAQFIGSTCLLEYICSDDRENYQASKIPEHWRWHNIDKQIVAQNGLNFDKTVRNSTDSGIVRA
jgi:hypothetical protein